MKYSKQRSLILDIVKRAHNHPNVDWIYAKAKEELPTIGISTVYRNLNALVEAGEIRRIVIENQPDRFDGHLDEHFHGIKKSSGELVDLYPQSEKSLEELKDAMEKCFGIADVNLSSVLVNFD